MLKRKHNYELKVVDRSREEIAWTTDHPQTAFRWYADTLESKRTIDTGDRVSHVALYRDGALVKEQAIDLSADAAARVCPVFRSITGAA